MYGHLWYKFIESDEVLWYHDYYGLIAIKNLWSNIEEHNIHELKIRLPMLSLAHVASIFEMQLDVAN
jgi:hypothetical protein